MGMWCGLFLIFVFLCVISFWCCVSIFFACCFCRLWIVPYLLCFLHWLVMFHYSLFLLFSVFALNCLCCWLCFLNRCHFDSFLGVVPPLFVPLLFSVFSSVVPCCSVILGWHLIDAVGEFLYLLVLCMLWNCHLFNLLLFYYFPLVG